MQVRTRLSRRWIRTSGSAPAETPLSDRGVKPQATASRLPLRRDPPSGDLDEAEVVPIAGTEGSNPSPSSGESHRREPDSNHRSLATRVGPVMENVETFADARRQAIPQYDATGMLVAYDLSVCIL